MIVSALVATCREPAGVLWVRFENDNRVEVGLPQRGFIPVVTTTETLAQARDLYEALRLDPAVVDLQLVSWADDAAINDEEASAGLTAVEDSDES